MRNKFHPCKLFSSLLIAFAYFVSALCPAAAQAQTISSATYVAGSGVLSAVGTGMTALDAVNTAKLTITGEGGTTYTLAPTTGVLTSSTTAFSVTLNSADKSAVNRILNKNGGNSTSGTGYNLAAADDWMPNMPAGDTSDAFSPITVSNVAIPTIFSGGATLLPLNAAFTNDIEAQKLYVEFYGRPADTAGAGFWATALTNAFPGGVDYAPGNASGQALLNAFAASQEFTGPTAGFSSAQLVNYFYQNMFGHAPDSSALAFWTNQLDQGSVLIRQLGPQLASAASGADLVAFNNKVAAAMLFTRSLNTAAELNGYATQAAYATGKGYLASVTDNTSLSAATANAALLATLNLACGFGASSSYDAGGGVLTVRGKNFASLAGSNNDIAVSRLTLSGDGAPYTMTSGDVDISSDTTVAIALNIADRSALATRLNQDGTISAGAVTYNIAAAEDWAAGADSTLTVAALTGQPLVVSGIAPLTPCAIGTYSPTGTTPCAPADPGNYVEIVGATSQTQCAPGSYAGAAGSAFCTQAGVGNFVPIAGSATQTPCAPGTYSNFSGAMVCTQASAGSFVGTAGASNQTACPLGAYSDVSGATACTPASAGFYVDVIGATAQTACSAGTYNPTAGGASAAACTLASAGNFVANAGSAAQTPCAAGTYSSATGALSCTQASAGNFVSTAGSSTQTACPLGAYSDISGATACTPASAGFYVGLIGATTQIACIAGTYNPTAGGTSSAACLLASAGNFVANPGSAAQTPCAAGTYSSATGALSCTQASAGNFVAATGASVQTPCALGRYSNVSGATACIPASAGFYVGVTGATAQTACIAGTYNPFVGGTSAAACILASAGNFVANVGSAAQTLCAAGTYSSATGALSCTQASAGSFVATIGSVTQSLCAPGSFSSVGGATTCTPAAIGFFVANAGAIEQTACPVGTTTLAPGATACALVGVTLTAVQSRKTHGATEYDILIDHTLALSDAISTEPRVIGTGHNIVFQFDGSVAVAGTASAVDAVLATIGSATASINPLASNEVIVTLTGIPDNKRVTVALTGVNGNTDVSAPVGFMIGDVNSNRSVNSSDISGVKARSGQATTALNFRFDVNVNGSVNSSDISAVKARTGLTLP
ncbi:MAG: DUF4214 domain-containing protein [Usitatibacteraceae bacterium]